MARQVFNVQPNSSLKRRKNTPLTDRQKLIIQVHYEAGNTPKQIQQLEVLKRQDGSLIRLDVVKKWIGRFVETNSMATKPRTGRPSKLNEVQTDYVVNLIQKDDEITYPEITHKIKKKFKIDCVSRTVNNYAIERGYRESCLISSFFNKSEFVLNVLNVF